MYIDIEKLESGYLVRISSNSLNGTFGFETDRELKEFLLNNIDLIILDEKVKKSFKGTVKVSKSEELKEKESKKQQAKKKRTRKKKS